ncbi:hypothetical protein PUNSTDRAFT_135089 [Punctularia strigosozonata HHB-11173 SS5]|uniref:uncharacterized protein n=1 Tax=Punctularia strigosozonata (strain HHB-11173) TaxID=741275 RepID=UPI000441747B|nr:uncharacterized protein PUNSTDRAFT_135089 [Punctularia strigosozonata HHB-11173 SS5]EIN07563.1 hypothetical protein PUNSTDRAFT_135089 [Punctularia strigosozonata HHB-11173 SS5]
MEQEIVQCVLAIFEDDDAIRDALRQRRLVWFIISAMNTPHVPTRTLLCKWIMFLIAWPEGKALGTPAMVMEALEKLSVDNPNPEATTQGSGGDNPYDYWFRSFEVTLAGRGKFGSLVGASKDVRMAGQDSSLDEYAFCNVTMLIAILGSLQDLDARLNHRAMLQLAGLPRITKLLRELDIDRVNDKLKMLQSILDEDFRQLSK